jgi:uncharacterized protein YqeY
MSIVEQINADLKGAMKAKDPAKLRTLRAIKSALLLAATDGSGKEVTDEIATNAIQKLAKQRKDSLSIYEEQGREDLAQIEREELEVISTFLPEQMSEEDVRKVVKDLISESGASGMGDMGKVMPKAMGALSGKADGKLISTIVREELS